MTEQAIEQAIQAAGKTAPRITPQHIENVIVSEHYFTAADGVAGVHAPTAERYPAETTPQLELLTFCVLVLRNGFTVTGESACASPENFDPAIGKQIARENARNKIWQLEGYLLKQNLYVNGAHTADENFEHFLSYSGFSGESPEQIEKLRKAYFDGGYALQWK